MNDLLSSCQCRCLHPATAKKRYRNDAPNPDGDDTMDEDAVVKFGRKNSHIHFLTVTDYLEHALKLSSDIADRSYFSRLR